MIQTLQPFFHKSSIQIPPFIHGLTRTQNRIVLQWNNKVLEIKGTQIGKMTETGKGNRSMARKTNNQMKDVVQNLDHFSNLFSEQ